MKTIKVKFYVSTNFVGCEDSEIVEIKIDEGYTQSEINDVIQENYDIWLQNEIDSGWEILD